MGKRISCQAPRDLGERDNLPLLSLGQQWARCQIVIRGGRGAAQLVGFG